MTSEAKQVKGCPFCGGKDNIHHVQPAADHSNNSPHAMNCRDCGSLGPWGDDDDKALELWNERE
jgi:Lar family restriction alleviation protein